MQRHVNPTELEPVTSEQGPSLAPVDTADMIAIARRGWLRILAGIIVGTIGALAMMGLLTPVYKASVRMVIEKSANKYLQSNKLLDGPMFDDADSWSQTFIISSESIIIPVVKSLNLTNDPDFVAPKQVGGLMARGRKLAEDARDYVGLKPKIDDGQVDKERKVFDAITRRLTVNHDDGPNVISISFESADPQKAAVIANAIADSYLASSAGAKTSSTQLANKAMQERLAELKTQAADAERTLIEYKTANNLFSSSAKTMSSEQVNSLNTQLSKSRIDMADSRARLDRMEQAVDQASKATFTPDNELITRLRAQYLDLSARVSDIEQRVGARHAAVIKLRGRMSEVNAAIEMEQTRVASLYNKDFELAKARYNELTTTITQVLREESSASKSQARLRELESAAETLRNLYNSMLLRFSETSNVDARPPIIPDARIVTRAAVPLQSEASKKKLILLFGGSLAGMLLGTAAVFAKENPFGVFRTSKQVKAATGLYCVSLPAITLGSRQKVNSLFEYVLEQPSARFVETLRIIVASMRAAQADADAKVFCVVSSAPGEGKTTIASNLACLTAMQSGTRTLVIDADLHRQTLTRMLAPDARLGLKEALYNPTLLADYVVKRDRSGLDVLPCPVTAGNANGAELLSSPAMEKLIQTARASYDLVIIDVAPIMAVADVRLIARLCDAFILLIEWGNTSQRLVLESLAEVSNLSERTLCVVLNKVDPKALESVERYKGRELHDYHLVQDRVATGNIARTVA